MKVFRSKLDEDEFAAGVFVDPKNAFDTVDHDILINKLEYYGARGVTKEWFCSYLKNRKQFASIDGFASKTKHISTGVPTRVSTWAIAIPNLYK